MVLDILGSGHFRPNLHGHIENCPPVLNVFTWLDHQFASCVKLPSHFHIKAHRLMILLCDRKDLPMIAPEHIWAFGRNEERQYGRVHVIDGSRENPVETDQADEHIQGENGCKKSHENVSYLSSR
jgi:hypothetical protein